MRKEKDKFELPTDSDAIFDYFYDLNFSETEVNGVTEGIRKPKMKETPKQFEAAVQILQYLMSNKNRSFTKADIFTVTSDHDDLADAYKHAITFLQKALLITNVHNGKTTTEWGLNPNLEVHVPSEKRNRVKKSHMVVGVLSPELSYENFEIAKDILKSKIYELSMGTFFGYDLKENENLPICDPELIPYWKEEIELIKEGGYSSQEEFNLLMYERTGDNRYLPSRVKDVFMF